MRDEHLVQLRLDPGARQAGQRVVPVSVLQVQRLQPQPVWLELTQLTSGEAFGRTLGKLLEFLRMDPDCSGGEGRLYKHAVANREDDAVLPGGSAPDALARLQSRPNHQRSALSPAVFSRHRTRRPRCHIVFGQEWPISHLIADVQDRTRRSPAVGCTHR